MPSGPVERGGDLLAGMVRELYREGQTDYALEPIVLVDRAGIPVGRIEDGDAVIFCCRRGEREIQLTEAFVDPELNHFPRQAFQNLNFVILTLYHEKFKDLPVAFAPTRVKDTLGEMVSRAGLRQLRVAESEKFAHVTFFFNGGTSQPFAGEEDIRVPSPQGIPYDQVPELSLAQVAEQVIRRDRKEVRPDRDQLCQRRCDRPYRQPGSEGKVRGVCGSAPWRGAGRRARGRVCRADHGRSRQPGGDDQPGWQPACRPYRQPGPLHRHRPALGCAGQSPRWVAGGRSADGPGRAGHSCAHGDERGILAPGHDWGGPRRVLLVILDGWGIGPQADTNPIFLAHPPVWDDLVREHPGSQLQAAGEAVGLQPGKAGNSEAGHMNLGAGRIVLQDDVRLDQAMEDGSFYTNEILCQAIADARQRNKSLHLIGLLTEKSSHGSIDYPLALLRMAKSGGLEKVFLHVIFDGRSTDPGSAPGLLEKLETQVREIGVGQIVSGIGRGIALDRDGNYAKTKRAYDLLVFGTGKKVLPERRRKTLVRGGSSWISGFCKI